MQIAPIVLGDGQATPVNKTFAPKDCTPQLATWSDRSSGISIGQPHLTLSVIESATVNKISGKIMLPVLETTSTDGVAGYVAAPKVAYQSMAKFELILPHRASLQNRKDTLAFLKNFLGNATFVTKAVEEFERPF